VKVPAVVGLSVAEAVAVEVGLLGAVGVGDGVGLCVQVEVAVFTAVEVRDGKEVLVAEGDAVTVLVAAGRGLRGS